uniref:HNH endonuclease signature motif containing protein n=1 Tax=uncultured Pseudokineococcus sp. TaxID=1642928 RepID=UPI002617755D
EHGRTDPHAATTAGLDPLALGDGAAAGLPDRRGIDARRFDVLVDLATTTDLTTADLPTGAHAVAPATRADANASAGTASAGATVTPRARSPHGPQVTVALTSLLGLDDDPAQHPTLGPVPAVAVAELLANGHRFRRALTAPLTGHLVGLDGHIQTLDPTTTAAPLTGPPGKGPGTTPARRSRREAISVRVETPDDPTSLPTSSPSPTDPAAAAAAPAAAAATTAAPAAAAGTTAAPAAAPAAGRAAVRAAATAAELASSPSSPSPPRPQTSPSSTSWHASLRHAARRSACSYAGATGGPGPYSPTDACARWVRTRSPRCQAPGCRMPATRCDLDHRTPHAAGGPTCPCNLDVLCRRHHLAKHHFGWAAVPTSDDPTDPSLTWTTPLGQVAHVPARPLLPRPAPRVADGARAAMRAESAAAAALEDRLLGPACYPTRDAAAHDLDRVHAELARQQQELRRSPGGDGGRSPSGRRGAASATASPSTAPGEADEAPTHQHDPWGDGEPPY